MLGKGYKEASARIRGRKPDEGARRKTLSLRDRLFRRRHDAHRIFRIQLLTQRICIGRTNAYNYTTGALFVARIRDIYTHIMQYVRLRSHIPMISIACNRLGDVMRNRSQQTKHTLGHFGLFGRFSFFFFFQIPNEATIGQIFLHNGAP